jgi:hypothetical protein
MLNEIFSVQKPLPMFEITEMTKPESHSNLDPLLYVSSPALPSERSEKPWIGVTAGWDRH